MSYIQPKSLTETLVASSDLDNPYIPNSKFP